MIISDTIIMYYWGCCCYYILPSVIVHIPFTVIMLVFVFFQHVHVHILPRKPEDFEQNDDIYYEVSNNGSAVIFGRKKILIWTKGFLKENLFDSEECIISDMEKWHKPWSSNFQEGQKNGLSIFVNEWILSEKKYKCVNLGH